MISVPPRPFCHRVSTRSSGDRLPWCPSRTPRRTVPSDSNLVSIPVLSRLVRKRSTPLPTPRTRRIEQTLVGCPCGHFPKRVWAPYSRPDAHPPLRTLEKLSSRRRFSGKTTSTQPRYTPSSPKVPLPHPRRWGGGTAGCKTPNTTSKAALGRRQRRDGRPCRKALIDFHRVDTSRAQRVSATAFPLLC